MPGLAIMFHRLGPYHLARCAAAGARCSLTALELCAVDDTYAWSCAHGAPNFERVTLFGDEDVDRRRRSVVGRGVQAALTAADPQVVAVPGWSRPGALAALLWCLRNGRPAKGIALTGFGMEDDVIRSKEAGFSEHITKPVNFQNLQQAIERVTAKA